MKRNPTTMGVRVFLRFRFERAHMPPLPVSTQTYETSPITVTTEFIRGSKNKTMRRELASIIADCISDEDLQKMRRLCD